MKTKEGQIEAIRKLPLRWHIRWLILPELFPGTVFEAEKNDDPKSEAFGKWGAVNLEDAECAKQVSELHNDSLLDSLCPQCRANSETNDAGGYFTLARECREYCQSGHATKAVR